MLSSKRFLMVSPALYVRWLYDKVVVAVETFLMHVLIIVKTRTFWLVSKTS